MLCVATFSGGCIFFYGPLRTAFETPAIRRYDATTLRAEQASLACCYSYSVRSSQSLILCRLVIWVGALVCWWRGTTTTSNQQRQSCEPAATQQQTHTQPAAAAIAAAAAAEHPHTRSITLSTRCSLSTATTFYPDISRRPRRAHSYSTRRHRSVAPSFRAVPFPSPTPVLCRCLHETRHSTVICASSRSATRLPPVHCVLSARSLMSHR